MSQFAVTYFDILCYLGEIQCRIHAVVLILTAIVNHLKQQGFHTPMAAEIT